MSSTQKKDFRILFLISSSKLADKATALFDQNQIPIQYHCRAQGTASSEIMDMLGLGTIEKNILLSAMPGNMASRMLPLLRKKLHLGMPNTGVAFTVPLSGCSGWMIRLMETPSREENEIERKEKEMGENGYSLIMAIVNQGYSEEVMDAARPKGASGGTVFHCRRAGSEEALKFWGIRVQQEREIVLILVPKTDKISIMQAISESCGMNTEAHGLILSLPVEGVEGLD